MTKYTNVKYYLFLENALLQSNQFIIPNKSDIFYTMNSNLPDPENLDLNQTAPVYLEVNRSGTGSIQGSLEDLSYNETSSFVYIELGKILSILKVNDYFNRFFINVSLIVLKAIKLTFIIDSENYIPTDLPFNFSLLHIT